MKLNFKMPAFLKSYYTTELVNYREAKMSGNLNKAWYHIERAHILGQRYPIEHSITHWYMLKLGWSTNDTKEILGQLPRLFFGGPLSLINKIPVGNVGSTRVSMIQPQPIPSDIQLIFNELENKVSL